MILFYAQCDQEVACEEYSDGKQEPLHSVAGGEGGEGDATSAL